LLLVEEKADVVYEVQVLHWIPVLRPAVDCLMYQSTTIRKVVGESKQP
jgi:hypothetical protein